MRMRMKGGIHSLRADVCLMRKTTLRFREKAITQLKKSTEVPREGSLSIRAG